MRPTRKTRAARSEVPTIPLSFRSRSVRATPTASAWGSRLLVFLRIALVAVAIWALRRDLAGVGASALWRGLYRFGLPHVALGLGLTAIGFLLLGAVELMALRFAGRSVARSVPRRVAVMTSFVANAFSQSIGFALLTGPAVRLRAYSRYGLDSAAITWVSAFVTFTATLGLLATGAVALLASPARLSAGNASIAMRSAGALMTLPVIAYLAWSAFGASEEIGRGRWRVCRPLPAVAGGQLLLSAIDWLLTGTVLYLLLPPSLSLAYPAFVRAYLVAQTLGVISHVPGGVGIFEAVLMMQLVSQAPSADRAALAASVVMFRVLYYLVPLVAAVVLSAFSELRRWGGSSSREPQVTTADSDRVAMTPSEAHAD